jgi:transcriptional regulator with PAS, ATPase and Fis domain
MDISDYKFLLDQIRGLIVIDLDGNVAFMSKQCGEYIKVDPEKAIGRPIIEVFPPTKMMDALKNDLPEITDFYFVDGRISGTTRFPLKREGKTVGLIEYDLFQEYDVMEEFLSNYINLNDELMYFRDEVRKFRKSKYTIENIIGKSEQILKLKEKIKYAARTNSTVVIFGETGTGKELVAHSIHDLSRRSLRNFITVNAAGLPEALVESELFGYEGGSFTGAKKEGKKGKFELANQGTLFIDEINHMPENIQLKLLRVLQEKEIEKIGGEKNIPIDTRIIVASNEDLKNLVEQGKFRRDLFYRLNVIQIDTPSLRERPEDIRLLVNNFVQQFNIIMGKKVTEIDEKVYRVLTDFEWPGNVRQLQNVIERAMNYVDGKYLSLEHFDFAQNPVEIAADIRTVSDNPIEEIKREAERNFILRCLEKFNGNKTKTAEYLNISRPLLYQKMKRLDIKFNKV